MVVKVRTTTNKQFSFLINPKIENLRTLLVFFDISNLIVRYENIISSF